MASEGLLGTLILLPLFGALLSYLFGMVSRAASGWVATIVLVACFLISLSLFQRLPAGGKFELLFFEWIEVGKFSVPFLLVLDGLSSVMTLVVTGIGTLIHLYSIGYMADDGSRPRFFAYLNLFISAMLTLVLGGTLPVVFIGWEGVGLCSFLLIGFWFQHRAFADAGKKAFIMNRIGDLGFLVAIFVAAYFAESVQIDQILRWVGSGRAEAPVLTIMAAGLFLAATGKSAQLPLFTWLPDAMAGPTPVSALIHAATMVTAGVYLMARMAPLYDACPEVLAVVFAIAILTALVAALIAVQQDDIKKVLAYSTVSQLGFMFVAVGCGAYNVALFHVVTHAFFKACLFLSAGSVIHGCHHEQDMTKMGGLWRAMPVTCIAFLLSTFAIAGIWPFSGYFSKHAIFESLAAVTNPYIAPYAGVAGVVLSCIALLTAVYMTRAWYLTFAGTYRGNEQAHESGLVMLLPVSVLALLAVFGGILVEGPLFAVLGDARAATESHEPGALIAYLEGSSLGLIGVVVALIALGGVPDITARLRGGVKPLADLMRNKFYIDEFYDRTVVRPLRSAAGMLWRRFDIGVADGGVSGVGYVTEAMGEVLRRGQTGVLGHYVFSMVIFIVILFGLYVLP
jgi:NADH-quinone oxidoreductase subunit L